MKWNEKIKDWQNGKIQTYPKNLKKRFFFETHVCDKNMENNYEELFIENNSLQSLEQDTSSFKKHLEQSKNKYVTTFDNLSKEDLKIFWSCLEKMIDFVCIAFDKLQFTYHSGPVPTNVILATQYFIVVLKASLNGTYKKELLPRCMKEGENKTFIDYDKIKLLWCGKKLQKIIDLYEKCIQISSSSDPTKDEQIDGYMAAISKLLMIHDEEFRKLIYLSNEG